MKLRLPCALLWAATAAADPGHLVLPELQVDKALERATPQPGHPLLFAEARAVDVTSDSHGIWSEARDGTRSWRLTISVPGATDLNLGFGQLRLERGASLHLESKTAGRTFERVYRSNRGSLWTAILPGAAIRLELTLPRDAPGAELRLQQVSAGFRDAWQLAGGPGLKLHGDCNNDVVCPEGSIWRDQIRSAALYSINGTLACSGSLINDVPESETPLFLSAEHCGVTADNAGSVVTYWNYEAPVCGDRDGGALDQPVSGATLLARRRDVDVLLLRLNENPADLYGAFYSGWDRSGETPAGSVGIHHPRVHVKSISFNIDPLTTTPSCIIPAATDPTHWEVDDWEDGTTERGSSGSGIWDPDTGLLVGFLSGGTASCSVQDGFDCYGKFAVAWDGPQPDQRLRDWLDPDDLSPMAVVGRDPNRLFRNGFEVSPD
ncbi:MAG: hypothetical protein R3200_13685 [Xanthomonadales bacterium]|nr:hypothetical protein [Xanthomonadales bacterium]